MQPLWYTDPPPPPTHSSDLSSPDPLPTPPISIATSTLSLPQTDNGGLSSPDNTDAEVCSINSKFDSSDDNNVFSDSGFSHLSSHSGHSDSSCSHSDVSPGFINNSNVHSKNNTSCFFANKSNDIVPQQQHTHTNANTNSSGRHFGVSNHLPILNDQENRALRPLEDHESQKRSFGQAFNYPDIHHDGNVDKKPNFQFLHEKPNVYSQGINEQNSTGNSQENHDPDRRPDLVGSHGGFGHLVSSSSASYGGAPRLSHPRATDAPFQPPYFPPPHNPHQAMDFNQHVDYYSAQVNPFQQASSQSHYNQIHAAERNVLARHDELQGMHHALTPYDQQRRQQEYMASVALSRRPDVLHHGLGSMEQDPSLLGLHHNPLSVMEDANQPHIEQDNFLTGDHNSVIRKGIRPKHENSKELVLASHIASPTDIFCSVPGRLSLLSSTSKYKVTVSEVQRRLQPPECLNASLLGGVLRRAKSKNGGRSLRDKLEKIGLTLPAGRRKAAQVTLLTSLVEGETSRLARDYTYLCDQEFPARPIAEHNIRHVDHGEYHARRTMMANAKTAMKELIDVMNKDRSPVENRRPHPVLEPGMQRHLTNFSLMTHGFGQPAMVASLNCALRYFDESLKVIDKSYSSSLQQPGAHPAHAHVMGGGVPQMDMSKLKSDTDESH